MDNKYIYLNLQEQVGKNKKDIADLWATKFNLERAGVRVVGEEASPSDLPDPDTYTGALGDAFLIGEEPPYDMYVYTQPSAGETSFKWVNLGPFPAPGVQGEQGEPGEQGPQGDASNWRFGLVNPSILETDRIHDGYLNTTTGMVFEFDGERWIAIGSIKGPQGIQGPQGPQGQMGPQGEKGDEGQQGPAGVMIEIIGVLSNVGSLPDPETVQRNAGIIIESGEDKDLYIVVEDENQDLSWYNAGPFTGTAGQAAGFGTVWATVTAVSNETPPSVTVITSGPNTAKRIHFSFRLPVGPGNDNQINDPFGASSVMGYTQETVNKKTMRRVFRSLADLGVASGATMQQIISAIGNSPNEFGYGMAVISVRSTQVISDAPEEEGLLVIIQGGNYLNPDVRFVDDNYNVYIYAGAAGTPARAIWHRLITSADGDSIGVPDGGEAGQILRKKTDDPYDTEWANVPNAPNGVPAGGAADQILAKDSSTDYDTKWVTPPVGIPSGGSTDQILKKSSNSDHQVEWANPPVGIPSGGTSGQALKKSSNDNYAASWQDTHEVPSGGTSGQVLAKTSDDDFAVSWQTPAAGGGGGPTIIGENLIINPDFAINQRSYSNTKTTVSANTYTRDRWMAANGATIRTDASNNYDVFGGSIHQYIDNVKAFSQKYIVIGVWIDLTAETGSTLTPELKLWTVSTSNAYGLLTPLNATPIVNTFGNKRQIVNVYQNTTPAASIAHFDFEIAVTAGASTDKVRLNGAFCHVLGQYSSGDLDSVIFPIVVNHEVEIEKCKYYYNRYKPDGRCGILYYGTSSPFYINFNYAVQINKMRIVPTIGNVIIQIGIQTVDISITQSTGALQPIDITNSDTPNSQVVGEVLRIYKSFQTTVNYNLNTVCLLSTENVNFRLDAEIYP